MDRIYVMQLVRSFQVGAIDRRTFLQRASAAVGGLAAANFLLAGCQPVTAGVPRPVTEATPSGEGVGSVESSLTTEDGLVAGMVEYPGPGGETLTGYAARPDDGKAYPAVIVIQEWWGLNDNIRDEADKYFSDLGDMNVIAVDMYDGRVAATPDSAMKIMRSADMSRMTAIIRGAIAYAGDKASIYSVGWCFGGMWSLQTAIIAGPKAKGTVMFYGRPESDVEKLKNIRCDVIGFFGNLDRSPAPAMVDAFEQNMTAAGKKLTVHRYEAGHGFANPSNPSFNRSATEDSYAKAIAFLKAH